MRRLHVSAESPESEAIRDAADVLRRGGLVAFPTETVYGLGANALDAAAVERIYRAKGRPSVNPLIVHVASPEMAGQVAREWPEVARQLAHAFWPGPLTLVVPRAPAIPDIVTAGGPTVGVRMPSHPVALALIAAAGVPVAAPSANRSNEVSPTNAMHVERSLGDQVDVILDGGQTTVGIESTVLDVTGAEPRVLRPGMITAEQLAAVVESAVRHAVTERVSQPRSPGMLGKHYAPRGRVVLFEPRDADSAAEMAREHLANGHRVGAMTFTALHVAAAQEHSMPTNAHDYARQLYATLHALDLAGCEVILVERPPETAEWRGVLDRLQRAAMPA